MSRRGIKYIISCSSSWILCKNYKYVCRNIFLIMAQVVVYETLSDEGSKATENVNLKDDGISAKRRATILSCASTLTNTILGAG
jgi:hypothetical protein